MSKTTFKWNDAALVPEVVSVDFSELSGTKDDKVDFHELSRTQLVDFVAESLEKRVLIEVTDAKGEVERNADGSVKTKARPFREVEAEHSEYLFKHLAVSTKGKKTPEYFAGLPLTVTGLESLVDMLLKINHVEEVIATSGNWLMLPTIKSLFAEATERNDSEPPVEILPVQ